MTVYKFAHNRTDITPTKNNGGNPWMAGYGWSPRSSRLYIANRKLYADCIAIKPDNAPPLLLVRLDVVSIPPVIQNQIRDHVVNQGHTNEQSFIMVASHTHSGPVLPQSPDPVVLFGLTATSLQRVDAYGTWLVNAVKQLINDTIVELAAQTQAITLKYGEGTADGLIYNRTDFPEVINRVPILAGFRGTTKVFVLFGYSAHPVCRGQEGFYDSDYPGVATKIIEDALGCPALFFLGCAGDQEPHAKGGNDQVVQTGTAVGNAVLAKIQSGLQAVDGSVVRTKQTAALPLVRDTENALVREQLIQEYKTRKLSAGADWNVRFCDAMLTELTDNNSPNHADVPMVCWKFGTDFAIMGIAGEPISRYDNLFRASTSRRLWVMGYANGVPCYIADDKLLWLPKYESGWYASSGSQIAGFESSMMSYSWPVPLKSTQPPNTTPPAVGTAEHVMRTTGLAVLA